MDEVAEPTYTYKDYSSDQEVRWCPGCGDYAILTAMQRALPELDIKKEDVVFISGIGCSSRFPYYMNTYGFHSIHGRAPAFATGIKLANPKLHVWQITGDGDALSIGGNHFMHAIRRNIDINILLFNNEIYGLTKGQYSPTSKVGLKTKSTPHGSLDNPFHPGSLVMGAGGTFFARVPDSDHKYMTKVFIESSKHRGTSTIEILQNCPIFNDKIHAPVTDKEVRDDAQVILEHGEPMLFGKEKEKGLVLDGVKLKIATIGENGVKADDILVHDAYEADNTLHTMLINMKAPDMPVAMGIIRAVKADTFNQRIHDQIEVVTAQSAIKSVNDLLNSGDTWEV